MKGSSQTMEGSGAGSLAILCLVFQNPVPGLEEGPLTDALGLAVRKKGTPFNRVVSTEPERCPGRGTTTGAVVVVAGDRVFFDGPDGTATPFDAGHLEPIDRSREVAHWIVSLFVSQLYGERVPMVDFPLVDGNRVIGILTVGGLYEYQPGPGLHLGAVELSGGVSLFDERLLVGIRIGYQPRVERTGVSATSRIQSLPVSLLVRGGWLFEPVLLRIGIGAGLEWRRFSYSASATVGNGVRTSVLPTLEGELEALVRLPRSLRLSLAGLIRGFLGGQGFTLQGENLYEAPRYSVGAVLRFGFVFPQTDETAVKEGFEREASARR